MGFDADTRNLPLAAKRIASLKNLSFNICEPGQEFSRDPNAINILLIHSNFEHLKAELANYSIESVT